MAPLSRPGNGQVAMEDGRAVTLQKHYWNTTPILIFFCFPICYFESFLLFQEIEFMSSKFEMNFITISIRTLGNCWQSSWTQILTASLAKVYLSWQKSFVGKVLLFVNKKRSMVIVMTGLIRVRACFATGGPNLDNLESIAPIRFTKPTSCALKNQQLVARWEVGCTSSPPKIKR